MVTSDGLPLVGVPALLDAKGIVVSPGGQISFVDNTGQVQIAGQMQLVRFANASGLRSVGGNLYEETISSGAPLAGVPGAVGSGVGALVQGFLESSNVSIVEEMVNMIQAQRAYEINSKAITTSEEMLGQMSQLKR